MAKKQDKSTARTATAEAPVEKFTPRSSTIWQQRQQTYRVGTPSLGFLDLVPSGGLLGDGALADVLAQYEKIKGCSISREGEYTTARKEGFAPSVVTVELPKGE
jgi:hypothetical protein